MALVSCKKDRFVDCSYTVIGNYKGDKVTYENGDTLYDDSGKLIVKYKSGKVLIEYLGTRSEKMEVSNCVGGYSTQVDAADDEYSLVTFNFFQDSLYYRLDRYLDGSNNWSTSHYYLSKY
ncbi:hypothetical protein JYT74_04000 [Crocinitomix catalasitica]|nr:hypothetical protein [Crocinitomix catalasitica]